MRQYCINDIRMDGHDPHILSALFLNQFTILTIQNPETSRAADHICTWIFD